jgi:hypothetical protein
MKITLAILGALAVLAQGLGAEDIPGWNGLPWGASETAVVKKLAGKIKKHDGTGLTATVSIGGHNFDASLALNDGGFTSVVVSDNHITEDARPIAQTVLDGLVAKYGTPDNGDRQQRVSAVGSYKWLRPSGSVSFMYLLMDGNSSILLIYKRTTSDPL